MGVFTRATALAAGLNVRQLRYRVKVGTLEEVLPGIYRYAGAPRPWEQGVLAAQMWAGAGAAASGTCAAALWGLRGIEPGRVEITVPRFLEPAGDWVVVRRAHLERAEIRTRRRIHVTCPERTLLDLGRSVPDGVLEAALDDALCRRMTTPDRLKSYLDARGAHGRRGTARLKRVTKDLLDTPGTDVFERLLFKTLKQEGLPRPVAQHRVSAGGRTFYLDFAYPAARLGIEAHSYRFHSERSDWEKDQVRHSLLTAEGWTIVYVTWRRLRDQARDVTAEIARTLERSLQLNDQKLAF